MESPPPKLLPRFEILEDSRVVISNGGFLHGATVPGTRNQVCVVFEHLHEFVLRVVRSGAIVELWDERPDRKPHWRSIRVEKEQPYACFPMAEAFRRGKEFFDAAIAAGATLDAEERAVFEASVSHGDFIIASDREPVFFRRAVPPSPKRKRVTQKMLDGGTDITA